MCVLQALLWGPWLTPRVLAASIKRILNLNRALPETAGDGHEVSAPNAAGIASATPLLNDEGEPIWKVLVFDNLGRDVISSVLRVNDLRALGITIHLYASRPPDVSPGPALPVLPAGGATRR